MDGLTVGRITFWVCTFRWKETVPVGTIKLTKELLSQAVPEVAVIWSVWPVGERQTFQLYVEESLKSGCVNLIVFPS